MDKNTANQALPGNHIAHLTKSFDASDELILITSVDGPITYLNSAGMRLLGLKKIPEGARMSDFRPKWAVEYTMNVVIPGARKTGQWNGETVMLDTEGREVPVRQSLHIISGREGQSDSILLVAREITESAEEADHHVNYDEYYRLFFEKSDEAIYLLNAATKRVLYANPAFFKYLKYEPEDLPNLYIYDFVFHEKSSIDGFLAKVWEKQEMHLGERQWKCKDGSVIDVLISLTLLAPDGIPVYVITARNITDEVAARKKFKASEHRYQQLVEHLNDGLLQVDNDDRIIFVNNRLCELTGYDPEDLIGKLAYEELLDIEGKSDEAVHMFNRQDGPFSDRYEVQVRLKSGEMRWFQNSSTRLVNESGKVLGSIGLLRDIQEQKETERRLQYKMRELDTFVYKASHDLKAPLNSLQGLLDLAMNEEDDSNLRQYLGMLNKKTAKMHSVLMGLLEVSVMQEGKVNLHPFNLRNFCLGIFESFEQKAADRGIDLRCTIPVDYDLVSDRKVLESVVQNLVHNAVNYHHPRGEGLFVELSMAKGPGKQCLFIADNGPGIPEAIQEKVFDMFYRGNNTSEGSGLGLYIVKTGAEKLGGGVKLMSEVGKGTTFELFLPLEE